KSNRTKVAKGSRTEDAVDAVTRYKSLQSGEQYSLIEVELISGRTHQIRAHLQSIGHPLLGDIKYGGKPFGSINHQLLHAWRIELPDGRSFRAPLPPRFREALKRAGLEPP